MSSETYGLFLHITHSLLLHCGWVASIRITVYLPDVDAQVPRGIHKSESPLYRAIPKHR